MGDRRPNELIDQQLSLSGPTRMVQEQEVPIRVVQAGLLGRLKEIHLVSLRQMQNTRQTRNRPVLTQQANTPPSVSQAACSHVSCSLREHEEAPPRVQDDPWEASVCLEKCSSCHCLSVCFHNYLLPGDANTWLPV